jgi:hypothetical protein|tara:strand:+ start:2828 stop:3904 length:1077 start_codon:yes stop_codon:yes gene_type:complete
MHVLRYLESYTLEDLTAELGIKVAQNDKYPDLYCLNYCQIKSPKANPIVRECRSLVLEKSWGTFKVVSRSFDRFFNYGEAGAGDAENINEMTAHEKVDGSLVGLFFYNGEWLYRTRSMIMPAEDMMIMGGVDLSWKNLIEETVLEPADVRLLDVMSTYIFEVVSPENRVVTRYDGRKAYLLAKRNNSTGEYTPSFIHCWHTPKSFKFDTYENCLIAAKELRDLNEGYVLYQNGVPSMKIKNPAYVAAHHLRGENALTPRRVIDLIAMNEHDEYLSIFPEDKEMFAKYIGAYKIMETETNMVWSEQKSLLPDRKAFALQVKDMSFSALLFQRMAKPDLTFEEWFISMNKNSRYNILGVK